MFHSLPRTNKSQAFTLIELLVVIAIIAILAAILFPVFAQAKTAAKGAVSISNAKQDTTATFIYSTDYDDMALVSGNNDSDAPFLLGTDPYKSWGYILLPYMKSYDLFQDPLIGKENPVVTGVPDQLVWAYRTQYGYNYQALCPTEYDYSTGKFVVKPSSAGSIAKPAETVLFTNKKSRNGNPDWYWVGSTVWGGNQVNAPMCHGLENENTNPRSVCVPNNYWGTGGQSYPTQNYEEGGFTGGVAFRKSLQSVVAYADGHVKTTDGGHLAAGTNWTKDTPYWSVQFVDKEKYIWDAD